jgi:hypothetical protein
VLIIQRSRGGRISWLEVGDLTRDANKRKEGIVSKRFGENLVGFPLAICFLHTRLDPIRTGLSHGNLAEKNYQP